MHRALLNPDEIYSGLFFMCLFDAILYKRSWIINPDRDSPKEMYLGQKTSCPVIKGLVKKRKVLNSRKRSSPVNVSILYKKA